MSASIQIMEKRKHRKVSQAIFHTQFWLTDCSKKARDDDNVSIKFKTANS